LAIQFLTRIPFRIEGEVTNQDLARSMGFYPVVGALFGLVGYLISTLVLPLFPEFVCAVLIVASGVVLSGNMHVDALMDSFDGLFSGQPRERVLEIMRDSRVGAHGVSAGVLSMLLKVALVAGLLSSSFRFSALVLVPVFGRFSLVYGAFRYPYARQGPGLGGMFTEHVGWGEIAVAAVQVVTAGLLLLGRLFLLVLPVYVVVLVAFHSCIARRLGGVTGDSLGAVNELVELAMYVVMLLL